jgi:hypothetical protein
VRAIETTIGVVLVLLAPVGLIYGWVCYFTPASDEPGALRGRATLLSLALISLAAALWLITMLYLPGADWRTGAGVGHQIAWEYARARVALYASLAALVMCLFGRPRLILPISVACIGTGLLWVVSTMP